MISHKSRLSISPTPQPPPGKGGGAKGRGKVTTPESPPPLRGRVRVGGSLALSRRVLSCLLLASLLLLVLVEPVLARDDGITDYVTIPAGSYIINMGAVPQTTANALKPYGLVYDLVKNQSVPVDWVINPMKAKDGVDFTDPNTGKSYSGGPFIIEMPHVTPAALAAINTWKAQGVLVDGPTTGPINNVPVYAEVSGVANVVLDSKNGSIAAGIMTSAGIPTTSYAYKDPSFLNSCDDVFALPHADPTWATHSNLLTYVRNGGYLWAGCHAVSVLENIDDPGTPTINPDMNFLSTTGLVPFGSHADGSPPYTTAMPSEPVMQYLGTTDAAQQGGSEQIYLPKLAGGWRPGAKVAVYDPTQANVPLLSPGPAAAIVFGRAFDNPFYGQVMYEGGHNVAGTAPANIAAMRAYLNFWLLGLVDHAPAMKASASASFVYEGSTVTAETDILSGVTYQWSSTGGGTFSAPTSRTTSFTPPEVTVDTTIYLKLKVTDACGRNGYDVVPLLVRNLPKADLAIVKTDSADPVTVNNAFSYALAVSNLGTEPATSVVVEDVLPTGLTYVSALGTGWTCGYDAGTRKVTCTRPTLNLTGGTPSVITLNVTAPPTTGQISNTATVSSALPDINMANNTSTQTTSVLQGIDVQITKTAPAGPFYPGQNFSYSLAVYNNSALTATSLTVKDILPLGPPGLTFVSAAGPGWNCVYSSPDRTLTCHLPSLAATNTSTITLTVTPTGAAGNTIANTATVTSPDFVDQNLANNSSTANITLSAPADLAITKTGTQLTKPNQDTWTVTLTNNGPGTATGIVVTDVMSGGGLGAYNVTTACTVTPSTGTINPASPWSRAQLQSGGTWSIPSLNSSASATLDFVCNGNNNNGVLNRASVTSSSYDNNAANNQASYWLNSAATKNGDIQITKTDSPDPVFVNGTVTYRITLNNLGTEDAKNTHTVIDTLPTGVTYAGYANVTGGGTWTCPATTPAIVGPATVTCTTNSDLKKLTGSHNTLFFDLLVTAPATSGSITNTATFNYVWGNDIYDPIDNNTATQQTTVIYRSTDIQVTKTVSTPVPPVQPILNENVTFTVTASNIGAYPASNLRLTDLLPAGLTYLSSTPSQGSYDPTTGLWYVGNVANGANATLQITAKATGTGTLSNTACFYAMDQTDTVSANNCATATVTPRYADLAVTKTVNNPTPNVNSNAVFTVTLTNNGPSAASAITLHDQLPVGLEYVSHVAGAGTYNQETGVWTVPGPLASGANTTLQLTAKVTAPETPFTNTATITASNLPDTVPANNTASVSVTGKQADIEVTKTVDIPVPLTLNQDLTFTITVRNNGPSAASGIVLADLLPAGLAYVSHTAGQGTYVPATAVWTVGALAAPTTSSGPPPVTTYATTTLTLVAKNTVYGNLTNTATKTAVDQYDPVLTNDKASVSIQSGGSADLSVTKSVDKPNTYQGDTVTFTVQLKNQGPDPATGVAVTDLLPAGLTYQSHAASQGTYDPATGVWTVGPLAAPTGVPPTYAMVTLTITATGATAGDHTNTVKVTALNQADPDSSNNEASASVNVEPASDLAVTKTGPTSVNLSAPVVYTLTATNNGPTNMTGGILTDTIPAQVTAVSWSCVATGTADCDTTAGGTGASGSGNAITLDHVQINAGAGNFLTITVNGTAGATGTFTNTVIFSPPYTIHDPNAANNSASVTTVVSNVLLTGRVFADTGTGGGTPNDGIPNGGEIGIAKVTVSLTNCAATPYTTTTTDGNGNYTLAIPNTVSPGATLCVVETNLGGYLSTGGQVGNTGGVYDRATDRVQFVLAANTNYSNVNFGDVPENRFLTDGAKAVLPGGTVSYPHIFIAGTGGQVSFSMFAAASPSITGWNEILYRDTNCDGVLSTPGDVPITGAITVTEGEKVCLIQQEFAPGTVPTGASNLVTIQANFVYTNASPALTATYTRQDLTTTSDVTLQLTKEVRNVTQAGPWTTSNLAKRGEVLEYRITYLNNGVNPINNLVIHDFTPAFTVYVSAAYGALPPNLTSCTVTAPSVNSAGPIKWTFSGSLASAVSGTVTYQVTVD